MLWAHRFVGSFSYKGYRNLLLGNMVFQTTYAMQNVILAWQMLQATDSALWIGLLAFTGGIPFLLGAPLTGILADRMNRQHLMAASAVLAALSMGWLALLEGSGNALPWHIAGISFLTGWSFTFYVPARMALIPNLVPARLVLNASTLDFSGGRVVGFLGPVLAGVAIEQFGIAPGLWLVVATSLVAVPILLNAGPELTIPSTKSAERHSVLADLRQAIIWMKTDRSGIPRGARGRGWPRRTCSNRSRKSVKARSVSPKI